MFFFEKFKKKRVSVWPRGSHNQNLKEIRAFSSEIIATWTTDKSPIPWALLTESSRANKNVVNIGGLRYQNISVQAYWLTTLQVVLKPVLFSISSHCSSYCLRWPRSTTPPVSLAALLWHGGATLTQLRYFDTAALLWHGTSGKFGGATLTWRRYFDTVVLLWHSGATLTWRLR